MHPIRLAVTHREWGAPTQNLRRLSRNWLAVSCLLQTPNRESFPVHDVFDVTSYAFGLRQLSCSLSFRFLVLNVEPLSR